MKPGASRARWPPGCMYAVAVSGVGWHRCAGWRYMCDMHMHMYMTCACIYLSIMHMHMCMCMHMFVPG